MLEHLKMSVCSFLSLVVRETRKLWNALAFKIKHSLITIIQAPAVVKFLRSSRDVRIKSPAVQSTENLIFGIIPSGIKQSWEPASWIPELRSHSFSMIKFDMPETWLCICFLVGGLSYLPARSPTCSFICSVLCTPRILPHPPSPIFPEKTDEILNLRCRGSVTTNPNSPDEF